MRRLQMTYTTAGGVEIPMTMLLEKVNREAILPFLTNCRNDRNKWCHTGGCSCAKYGARPCCPPQVKMFNEMRERKYMYLFASMIEKEAYLALYPKQAAQKGGLRDYFFMQTSHYLTRGTVGRISDIMKQPGEQTFKVGGCNGCTFSKDGRCKDLRPALEATGIDVCKMTEVLLETTIQWRKPGEPLDYIIAVSGLYTDRKIKSTEFYEAFKIACNMKGV